MGLGSAFAIDCSLIRGDFSATAFGLLTSGASFSVSSSQSFEVVGEVSGAAPTGPEAVAMLPPPPPASSAVSCCWGSGGSGGSVISTSIPVSWAMGSIFGNSHFIKNISKTKKAANTAVTIAASLLCFFSSKATDMA